MCGYVPGEDPVVGSSKAGSLKGVLLNQLNDYGFSGRALHNRINYVDNLEETRRGSTFGTRSYKGKLFFPYLYFVPVKALSAFVHSLALQFHKPDTVNTKLKLKT
jgi:hypothetical protein